MKGHRLWWCALCVACVAFCSLSAAARSTDHDEPASDTPAAEPSAQQSVDPASSDSAEPGRETTDKDDESADEAEESEAEPEPPPNPFQELPKAELERSLSGALSHQDAWFCKAQDDEPLNDEHLCSLSKSSVLQRCPGLKQACHTDPAHQPWKAPIWLGSLADLAFWALLIALAVVLLVGLLRSVGAVQLEPRAPPPRRLAAEEPARAPRRAGEGDVARLWTQAEQAAAASRFDEAVATLQAALIHALRIAGKLHVSPALTNGDYLRALRPEPTLHAPAREVFRAVEAVQFGGAVANAELYRKLFERVQPIVTRVLAAVLLYFLCLSQASCGQGLNRTFEGSGNGLGVLTQLLSEQHTTVRRRVRPLKEIEPEVMTILVVDEQPKEVWSRLLRFAATGGTLIVTGKDESLEKTTGAHFTPNEYSGLLDLAPGFEPSQLQLAAVARHALELPEAVRPSDRTFALAQKRPYVAQRGYGAGRILYFADDDFLSNASLSLGDNAFFTVSLLRSPGHVLELVGPWTGGGAESTFSALFKAGLGVLLAQLALLALLYAWQGGAGFGSPLDPVAAQRRAFRDHVLALGANYRKARATRFALATYGSWLIERLRDRLSPQQPIGLIDLAGRVATRVGQPEGELVVLLSEARDAQEDLAGARPSADDLETLDKLESLTLRAGGSK